MFRPKPVKLAPRWDLMNERERDGRPRLGRGRAVPLAPLDLPTFEPREDQFFDEPETEIRPPSGCGDPNCMICYSRDSLALPPGTLHRAVPSPAAAMSMLNDPSAWPAWRAAFDVPVAAIVDSQAVWDEA